MGGVGMVSSVAGPAGLPLNALFCSKLCVCVVKSKPHGFSHPRSILGGLSARTAAGSGTSRIIKPTKTT